MKLRHVMGEIVLDLIMAEERGKRGKYFLGDLNRTVDTELTNGAIQRLHFAECGLISVLLEILHTGVILAHDPGDDLTLMLRDLILIDLITKLPGKPSVALPGLETRR